MGRYSHRPTTLVLAPGDKHGRLTAIRHVGSSRQGRVWLWLCCCGREAALPIAKVLHGRTVSCGCRRGRPPGHTKAQKAPKPRRLTYKERVNSDPRGRYEVVVGDVVMAIAPCWSAAEKSARTFGGTIRRSD